MKSFFLRYIIVNVSFRICNRKQKYLVTLNWFQRSFRNSEVEDFYGRCIAQHDTRQICLVNLTFIAAKASTLIYKSSKHRRYYRMVITTKVMKLCIRDQFRRMFFMHTRYLHCGFQLTAFSLWVSFSMLVTSKQQLVNKKHCCLLSFRSRLTQITKVFNVNKYPKITSDVRPLSIYLSFSLLSWSVFRAEFDYVRFFRIIIRLRGGGKTVYFVYIFAQALLLR